MLVRVLCQLTAWTRWNVATAVILLNILISLFASAYEDVRCMLFQCANAGSMLTSDFFF